MSDKYGVAILGAGRVAGEYVKAFRDHPKTELLGVYNRYRQARRAACCRPTA